MPLEKIELTDEVRQSPSSDLTAEGTAIAYLVFDRDGEMRLFEDFSDAEDFANRQLDDHETKQTWDVYPLFATHPIEIA